MFDGPANRHKSSPVSEEVRTISVYEAVAKHQLAETTWIFREFVDEFIRWRDIFNDEFKLDLTPTVFRIGGARSGCYGHFRPSPNDFGLPREIAFNERHLIARLLAGDFWKAIGTLLHELLHAWQFDHGNTSPRNHHNRELRDKAASFGLIMAPRGYTDYEPCSPFMDLLKAHGVHIPEVPRLHGKVEISPPGSKLKKWRCQCTNVRVAICDFQAICLKCGEKFTKQI